MEPAPPARRPWLLIIAALVMALLLAYVLLGAYLPAKQRMTGLEAEIKQVYQKEVELQTQLAQSLQRIAFLEQRITALTAERDALARRTQELEQQLSRRRRR
jgi:septal ring factor EnvC (AmiA/AmiB activator)